MSAFQKTYHPSSKGGFSLIEVTLALGIFSVTMVSFMGVLMVGLSSQRRSVESDSQREIFLQMLSQVQETPYSSLSTAFNNANFYFLNDGTPATSGTAFYTVNCSVKNLTLPGAAANSSSLQQVTFQLASLDKQSRTYTVNISDNGN